MRIYLASGYSVMNIKKREEELYSKLGVAHRLVSFYDYSEDRNKQGIENVFSAIRKINENISVSNGKS